MRPDTSTRKGQPAKKKTFAKSSYVLKRDIIDLIINGRISKNHAAYKYSISRSLIDYWIKKFSTFDERQKLMSKNDQMKKLRERIQELELIKDFQQDLIFEFELATGKQLAKKFLPGQLAKEIEKKKRASK